ncbi:scabin-related ADP-ribosyltransferase [Streptomyces axinellae]|uniref:Pierisin-like domain-containing protein n=1 Tax=Streptomyces axinellae TaxID=552788 RepID=A0ABN3Q257_9ACTN
MDSQERADYSDAEGFGSEADSMEGSYEGWDNHPEQVQEALEAFPGRMSGRARIEAVGYGDSKYGINPQDIRVANSGPSGDNEFVYRLDELPLYRWESRGPEIVFEVGLRNKNNLVPSSLQYYQNNHRDTALVSFTRDKDPAAAKPVWLDEVETYRYCAPNVRGGIDIMASLPEVAYRNQQEVVFWKGMRPEFLGSVDAFSKPDELNPNGRLIGSMNNPRASPETRAAQAQLDRETAWERVREAAQFARNGQASEYDVFRQQYAEWHLRSGRHTEHAALDGNLRSYAEWWATHRGEAQRLSRDWADLRAPSWGSSPPQPPPATADFYARAARLSASQQSEPQRTQGQSRAQAPVAGPGLTDTPQVAHPSQPAAAQPLQGAAALQQFVAQGARTHLPSQAKRRASQELSDRQNQGATGPGGATRYAQPAPGSQNQLGAPGSASRKRRK